MKSKILLSLYSFYFLIATVGILKAGDDILPNELSVQGIGHAFTRIFAYGSVETVSVLTFFLPKEVIAQTDTFICVNVHKTSLTLLDISKKLVFPTLNLDMSRPVLKNLIIIFKQEQFSKGCFYYPIENLVSLSTIANQVIEPCFTTQRAFGRIGSTRDLQR